MQQSQSPFHFQLTPLSTTFQQLKHKLEIFFLMLTTHLQNKTPLTIAVIDLDKTSKYNFDKGYYSLPDESEYFHYTEYTLSSHSHKIAQLLKLSSILYYKLLNLTSSTKRELYYHNVDLFKSIDNIDTTISDLCSVLIIDRLTLPIFPSAKGLFCGNITLYNSQGNIMNITNSNITQHKINLITYEYINECFYINNNINTYTLNNGYFILVVEKETLFFNLIENHLFYMKFPNAIVVTGKGFPDLITKVFIKKLYKLLNCNVPLFYFGDSDPHGFEIFLNYFCGSKGMSRENEFACLNEMQWIGLSREVIMKVNKEGNENVNGLIKLNTKEINKIKGMMQREYFDLRNWEMSVNENKENVIRNLTVIYEELKMMMDNGFKAEGEFLLSQGGEVFVDVVMENIIRYSNEVKGGMIINDMYYNP